MITQTVFCYTTGYTGGSKSQKNAIRGRNLSHFPRSLTPWNVHLQPIRVLINNPHTIITTWGPFNFSFVASPLLPRAWGGVCAGPADQARTKNLQTSVIILPKKSRKCTHVKFNIFRVGSLGGRAVQHSHTRFSTELGGASPPRPITSLPHTVRTCTLSSTTLKLTVVTICQFVAKSDAFCINRSSIKYI